MEKKLEEINQTLSEMSGSLKIISSVLATPESILEKVIQYVMAGVSIAGIVATVDIVLKWLTGG